MTSKEALAALTPSETKFISRSPAHHHYHTYQPFGVGIFLPTGLGSYLHHHLILAQDFIAIAQNNAHRSGRGHASEIS
jgi:hypothetical protein